MIIEKGNKIHIVYRALYENSTRRHFVGEINAVDGTCCRIEGYEFVYDSKTTMYVRKPEKRITIIDVAESGYIVNMIRPDINIDEITYRYKSEMGLVATDNKSFTLNINEFGSKS
jgi:hypothetical protein